MANVKTDLLQELGKQKYFAEIELVRLANDPNMNYAEKIAQLDVVMGSIALLNIKGELTEQYFQEAQPEGDAGDPEGAPEAPADAADVEAPEAPVDNVVEEPAAQQSHSE